MQREAGRNVVGISVDLRKFLVDRSRFLAQVTMNPCWLIGVAVIRRGEPMLGVELFMRLHANGLDEMRLPILICGQAQRLSNATKLWLPGFPAGFRVFRYGRARP